MISLISALFSLKNTFLLYFGANTMWYLQFHVVCAKLFVSVVCSGMTVLLMCFLRNWQVTLLLYTLGVFLYGSSLKLFGTMRLSRGFQ